jgi:hypothetical protein
MEQINRHNTQNKSKHHWKILRTQIVNYIPTKIYFECRFTNGTKKNLWKGVESVTAFPNRSPKHALLCSITYRAIIDENRPSLIHCQSSGPFGRSMEKLFHFMEKCLTPHKVIQSGRYGKKQKKNISFYYSVIHFSIVFHAFFLPCEGRNGYRLFLDRFIIPPTK